jgi:HEAT repeat protein
MDEPGVGEPGASPPRDKGDDDSQNNERFVHFIRLLSDDDEVSRWKAAEALGRMGDPAAVEDLIGTLWDDDERVRLKAAWALGRIADPRAYAPLRRLYRMENERVKEIIAEALENIRLHTGNHGAGI